MQCLPCRAAKNETCLTQCLSCRRELYVVGMVGAATKHSGAPEGSGHMSLFGA